MAQSINTLNDHRMSFQWITCMVPPASLEVFAPWVWHTHMANIRTIQSIQKSLHHWAWVMLREAIPSRDFNLAEKNSSQAHVCNFLLNVKMAHPERGQLKRSSKMTTIAMVAMASSHSCAVKFTQNMDGMWCDAHICVLYCREGLHLVHFHIMCFLASVDGTIHISPKYILKTALTS